MNAVAELSTLSGIEQLRAIFAGRTGYEGIVKTFDLRPVSAEEGFVVFEGSPTKAVYNPLGSVHGGYAAARNSVSGFCMFAMLNARSVVVPCAYKTIGRAPVQLAPAPVGTINAADPVVASFAPPTVVYWM